MKLGSLALAALATAQEMAPYQGHAIPSNTRCKKNIFFERIVNGIDAEPNSWPWLVSMVINGKNDCGGSILDENHILTAAHCCLDENNKEWPVQSLKIIAGAYDFRNPINEQLVDVTQIFSHPNYNPTTKDNDICVLKTNTIRIDGKTTDIVCLPEQGKHVAPSNGAENCYSAGWGDLKTGGPAPDLLKSVTQNVLSTEECFRTTKWQAGDWDPNVAFCASFLGEGKGGVSDTCQGDSGGPLVCIEQGSPVLYGVVSFGGKCADPTTPGIYAKVGPFINWMKKIITGDDPTEVPTGVITGVGPYGTTTGVTYGNNNNGNYGSNNNGNYGSNNNGNYGNNNGGNYGGNNGGYNNGNNGGSGQKPQVSNQRPQVSNQRPQVSNQRPQVSNQKPQVSNQRPQVSNQKPQVSNQRPQVSNQKPQVSNQKPQPGTGTTGTGYGGTTTTGQGNYGQQGYQNQQLGGTQTGNQGYNQIGGGNTGGYTNNSGGNQGGNTQLGGGSTNHYGGNQGGNTQLGGAYNSLNNYRRR